MLCHGKVLRTFDISVGELLKRSEKSHPIIFQPDQGEVVSWCASLLILVEQRRSDENDALVLRPYTALTSGDKDVLVLRTDARHGLLARYRKTQSSKDLGQSIKHFEHALDICPMDHPCLPAALFNLAIVKFVSCQANGAPSDLDISIALLQDALDLRPTGHPDRPVTQLYLAIALRFRFAKWGYRTDADAAEESLSEVLDVCHANSHIYRAALLAIKTSALYPAGNTAANDLGQERLAVSMLPLSPNQLVNLAEQCLGRDDHRALDEVISLHYDALGYYDAKHVRRGQLLTSLCIMLITRFERRSNHGDLDRAIALQREALALHPAGHPDRFLSLNNLANQLSVRFDHRGKEEDLDQAIVLQMEARGLCPVGHPDRSMSLNNLANELSTRFHHRGNDEDLDQAIALQREAQTLFPVGHPNRSSSLSNLATELSTRFHHRGNDEDLDDAIALQSEVLALSPAGHIDRPSSLNNLANLLSTRFKHRGKGEDLDAAIALHREALALCPVGHTTRSLSLSNLAGDLSTRFEHRGNDEDLDDAIALLRESLGLRPPGHNGRPSSLNNLANRLSTRFRRRGNDEDLDIAIALHREVLALCPIGHASRSLSLNNIAGELSTRFDNRGNDEDLDDAIAFYRESLALRPVGHVYRPSSLHNLADRLSTRFEHQHNEEDLNESRENLRSALALLTQHDPRRLLVYKSLATVYLLFHQSGFDGTGPGKDIDSLNAAMDYSKAAINVVSGGLLFRLRASLSWVYHANRHTHSTELEAYATSMQLLDAYMSATASVSSRHSAMMDFPPTLAADAASCAIRSGDVRRAVELLERGRTLIWTQMARFRTPLDNLPLALAKTFRDISLLLDKPPTNYPEGTSIVVVEAEATRYRRLVEDWNGAVEEIRKIEGFSRFLLSPAFSDLQYAACDGPTIMLMATNSSCDAIIIPHK
ncbi:hypothetical protein CY34DRAFT_291493 [Suillus luteus UH-Slu-Lm8-n1]|uniref:Unplaced genomic scaffold CY34scaffold_189, whole genome shotgun sequence n=1 Tax=Suillus luteus UH-Slu-Lm8-n1 TaxID=930992 RepID=A0A0D0B8G6_9AGAM|nr:hypothetical protein CY34DRAFT_291493 [Suillus luteus UH-Slu-Lm8-n1]